MNLLQKWMACATPQEKLRLARLAKTSIGTLRQIAGGYKTNGALHVESDLARRIEVASTKIIRDGLPLLKREALSPACAKCEFAKACRS